MSYYERLTDYKVVERSVLGKRFRFVVEKTRKSSFHACTIDDIVTILEEIPLKYHEGIELIILRQPKRKEEILKPVWGRLLYSFTFEKDYFPAIVIEANDLFKKFRWGKNLDIEDQYELDRLRKDGHDFKTEKRYFEAALKLENIRSTQLYRTLLHEIGHYVHYLSRVRWPLNDHPNEDNDELSENLWDAYVAIPTTEKEVFAHQFADRLAKDLTEKQVIPFPRKLDFAAIEADGLNIEDFCEPDH